ncbi:DUF6510 family protein [Sphingomonas sp. PR090111-T3T-6A]|uniref:DUF6510 family protein n=1 Tax=Sphingomonas sp. PR090111-T3T-6A TaxID=685778 RepID=UPI000374A632|nr:DUF6510 family protein [Sphingomonas sp. PR090111-T3T-6A]
MIDESMVLDGNAAAGALEALFAFDVTTAIVHCGHCRVSGPLAELRFYGSPRAMVLRCKTCGEVNVRLLETDRTINLDLSGAVRIEVRRPT